MLLTALHAQAGQTGEKGSPHPGMCSKEFRLCSGLSLTAMRFRIIFAAGAARHPGDMAQAKGVRMSAQPSKTQATGACTIEIPGMTYQFLQARIQRAMECDQLDTGHLEYVPNGPGRPRSIKIPWDPLVTIYSQPKSEHVLECTLNVDGVDRPGTITANLAAERMRLSYE